MGKNVILHNGGPNVHNFAYAKRDHFGNGFIYTADPENIDIGTIFIPIHGILTELLSKNELSVMAAHICILCKLPKGAGVALPRIFMCTIQGYQNAKNFGGTQWRNFKFRALLQENHSGPPPP